MLIIFAQAKEQKTFNNGQEKFPEKQIKSNKLNK
jgi:hypothetical protein